MKRVTLFKLLAYVTGLKGYVRQFAEAISTCAKK